MTTVTNSDFVSGIASVTYGQKTTWLAAKQSGLYLSLGERWQNVFEGLGSSEPVAALCVVGASRHENVSIFVGIAGGVLRSDDGGETWEASFVVRPAPVVSALAVSPAFAEDGIVLAGSLEDGVIRSVDGGKEWSRWNFGLLDPRVLSLAVSPGFAADKTVLAGTETGLFVSETAGCSWIDLHTPAGNRPVDAATVTAKGTWVIGQSDGLYLSDDRGGTWQTAEVDISSGVESLCASLDGRQLAAVADGKLHFSIDGGSTWQMGSGDGADVVAVAFDSSASLLTGRVSGEVLVTTLTKETTWQQ